METIEYQLKCNPEISVKVLAEYGKKAKDFVDVALKGVNELKEVLDEHPYLTNPGVLSRTTQLIQNQKSKRLQDIVYLRICVWGNKRRINNGDYSEEVVQIENNLIQKIEFLESCRDN